MNRREEYLNMLQELEKPIPTLEYTVQRAEAKRKKRNRIFRPLTSFAVICLAFVLTVNFCAPIAEACSKIPVLKELAEAVTFSNSLTDAVDNEYVQPLNLKGSKNGIAVSVEYLIVDQKQVNIFYRINSSDYTHLAVDPQITAADGSSLSCSYTLNDWDVPNGELQSITVDFVDEDLPSTMKIILKLSDENAYVDKPVKNADFPDTTYEEPSYLANFQFQLNFDPEFTVTGKQVPVDKTVVLDGQKITFTDVEIYPTHMRINVKSNENNTQWLNNLKFYIIADGDKKFEPVTNGITATGSADSVEMDSYRADSTYFYKAKKLKIVITGANWLDKSKCRYHIELKSGKSEKLPLGLNVDSVKQKGMHFKITFSPDDKLPLDWFNCLYGPDGKEYRVRMWDSLGSIYVQDYPYDEAWISPWYNKVWRPKSPVELNLQ